MPVASAFYLYLDFVNDVGIYAAWPTTPSGRVASSEAEV